MGNLTVLTKVNQKTKKF